MPGGLDRRAELAEAVDRGALPANAVSTSAHRIIELARSRPGPSGSLADLVDAHDDLARRAAAASAVVLTNDGVLPLARDRRIAVIGAFAERPRFQGSGSSLVTPTRTTTVLNAFDQAGIAVDYAPGYDADRPGLDAGLLEQAVAVASGADVAVVMVGLPAIAESEGFDRTTLDLPAQHDRLVAAVAAVNDRTVVVLSNGSPVLMPWHADVAAILECYLGGQASGGAVVDALLGVVEPSGRLAETFPAAQEHIAADPYFPGGARQVQYREGLFVGYRHATTAGLEPLFGFGHGLGYGATTWSEPTVNRGTVGPGEPVFVSVTVENTGDRPTREVVQVYAHDVTGVVLRPRRELAGFTTVPLAPGERHRVDVEIDPRAFAFWDVRVQDWRTPAGVVELEVGRSSERIEATLAVTVHGDVFDAAEPADAAPVAADDADFVLRLGRPVPEPIPARPFTRETTIGDFSVTLVGRALRALTNRMADVPPQTRADPVTMALIQAASDELPLRGLVQFSNGRLSWRLVDAVIAFANWRPAAALRRR